MTVLYPFQKEDLARVEEMGGRVLIASDMGTGKSLIALSYLANHPELRPAVIICPAHLKYNWANEARKHLGIEIDVLEGRSKAWKSWTSTPPIMVLNYDILEAWLPWLISIEPKLVIADECHAVSNPQAIRTRALRNLLRLAKVEHFIPISATPITNRPIEFWSALNMLDSSQFPSYYAFGHNFTKARRTPWNWDFSGAKNLDKLHERLKGLMIRRLKKDVLRDLPDKQQSIVPIPLSSKREYQKADKDFVAWLRKNFTTAAAVRAMRAEALAKTTHLKTLAAKLKMPAVMEWVDNFLESGEKLIIFGVHKSVVKAFQIKYGKKFCAEVTGKVTGRNRQVEFDRFNDDPECRLFAGNLKAAGTGWSANACSNVAHIELAWNPATHSQAGDRTHGINRGQEGICSMNYWLVAKDSIEMKMCDLLTTKQKNLDQILDGGETEEASVFDSLVQDLLRGNK